MDVRDALVQRISKRMTKMREVLERFTDRTAERYLVNDDWNVRDLVAHLAHWTGEGADQISLLAAGKPKKDYDIEGINETVFKKNRRMSFVMLLPQLRAAEERFLTAVRSVNPELLVDETPVRQWIDDVGIKHYDAHWRGLEEVLERMD